MWGLGTVLDKLQGLLGKGYLLAGFLPVLVFAVLSALLARMTFDPARLLLDGIVRQPAVTQTPYWALLVGLIAVIGFLFWSVNPSLRHVLEGSLLPPPLRAYCERRQRSGLEHLENDIAQLRPELFHYRRAFKKSPTWFEQLKSERDEDNNRAAASSTSLDDLQAEFTRFSDMRRARRALPYEDMQRLFEHLKTALGAAAADNNEVLDGMHQEFVALAQYALGTVENAYSGRVAERRFRYPEETDLGPTAMANAARLHRDYALSRYGMDIEVFWLRMQKIVMGDDRFRPILEEAKTQLDVSVAMTAVFGALVAVWAPLVIVRSTSLLLYLAVVGGGSVVTAVFYKVALQHFRAFSELVRSAVDLYRFDLLRLLHVPLPKDSAEEKQVWETLTRQYWLTDAAPLAYQHQ